MEYDLINLFDHFNCCLFEFIPSAIAVFSTPGMNRCTIPAQWRRSASEPENQFELTLKWDLDVLRVRMTEIDLQIHNRREWNDDKATQTEEAAIVVAVAVLSHIEPDTLFTRRSTIGTRHDYYLNSTRDEMIEIAGRWDGGLPGLFDEKKAQSDLNTALRKRWVSVTIVRETPRNRTEGLHS
jgi:hypothetical protein